MNTIVERRLRRLEERRSPSMPMQALIVMARDTEDATRQLADAVASGKHQLGWPTMIVTGVPQAGAGGQLS